MALLRDRRVFSEPCEVVWAGFRSNTFALQQAGWDIAVNEDVMNQQIELVLRNRDWKLYAITRSQRFDYLARRHERGPLPTFVITHCAPRVEAVRIAGAMDFSRFTQVDAAPQVADVSYESIEDFAIFATPLVRTEEIIVEPASVSALLEQIKRMQAPEQAAIRERNRDRERRQEYEAGATPRERQQFHAQIVSLDNFRKAA